MRPSPGKMDSNLASSKDTLPAKMGREVAHTRKTLPFLDQPLLNKITDGLTLTVLTQPINFVITEIGIVEYYKRPWKVSLVLIS